MAWEELVQQHSGGVLILILATLLVVALLTLIPQLLRTHLRSLELQHEERVKAIEAGQKLPQENYLRRAAGRVAVLVPAIGVIAAAVVTCCVAVYKLDSLIALTLTVWCVVGVIGLAAITAGVALMGRLAHLDDTLEENDSPGQRQQQS